MSHFPRLFLFIVATVLLVSLSGLAEAAETKINKKDLPAPVLAAFHRDYPMAKITGASRETENGAEYYEIESKQGGIKRDVLFQPDGVVISVEEKIRTKDLPVYVRDALKKEHPKGRIKSAEKLTRSGVSSFEVVVKEGKRVLELSLAPDGTITKTEEVTGKDND